jgi:metal-sulfur cluster biosynthetic enzyme
MARIQEVRRMAITEEQIWNALRECYDPEVPVNIVDLGLIYNIGVDEDRVDVEMTLTSRGCPASSMISQNVRNRILQIPEVRDASVRIVWDPAWTPARMSEQAKLKLQWNG